MSNDIAELTAALAEQNEVKKLEIEQAVRETEAKIKAAEAARAEVSVNRRRIEAIEGLRLDLARLLPALEVMIEQDGIAETLERLNININVILQSLIALMSALPALNSGDRDGSAARTLNEQKDFLRGLVREMSQKPVNINAGGATAVGGNVHGDAAQSIDKQRRG